MSILSFPHRGPWGDSKWRGNCSGYVYQDLFKRLKPNFYIDPMVGSGTSTDVANEMGIEAIGLDLHSGFNILRDSILERAGKQADLVVSHPPYGNQVVYSGEVWGEPHPDDLSRCKDDDEFHQKLQQALLNQREATKDGGVYGTLIGDYRKNGRYTSYQAEAIARMPSAELMAVIIKQQHNVMSNAKQYPGLVMPRIMHEYLLLWKRKQTPTIFLLRDLATEQANRLRGTWRAIIRNVVIALGGSASLKTLYEKIAAHCDERVKANPNWQAKVRQILNSTGDYVSVSRGVWALA
ncbi:hypothetical protein LPN04_31605 [Rugamonas sp. A1-17]|nr:hypothetical protein [Rugamonas sp. A1-17]